MSSSLNVVKDELSEAAKQKGIDPYQYIVDFSNCFTGITITEGSIHNGERAKKDAIFAEEKYNKAYKDRLGSCENIFKFLDTHISQTKLTGKTIVFNLETPLSLNKYDCMIISLGVNMVLFVPREINTHLSIVGSISKSSNLDKIVFNIA